MDWTKLFMFASAMAEDAGAAAGTTAAPPHRAVCWL